MSALAGSSGQGTAVRPAGDFLDWRNEAACREEDPEMFFPEGTAGPALRQAEQARRCCRSCPVRLPCLRFALVQGLEYGIWGGVDVEERRFLRRSIV